MLPSHPFYIVPVGKEWRVFKYSGPHDVGHPDYWRQSVALVVAKYTRLSYAALRELPYCLPRGRFVARCSLPKFRGRAVLFFGEALNAGQRRALKTVYGEIPIVHDEHEVRLPADVQAYEALVRKAQTQVPAATPGGGPRSKIQGDPVG